MPNGERSPRPGLAKIRSPQLLQRRRVELVSCSTGPLQGLFEHADVVSEGSTREERGALVYYGSTSLVVVMPLDAPLSPSLERAILLDPHLRLRALRVAQREAIARAGGPLGPLHAEMRVHLAHRAAAALLTMTIDVTARVLTMTARPSHA